LLAFDVTSETIRTLAAVREMFEQLIGPPVSTDQAPARPPCR
jgi:hypothetical protein